MKKRGKKRSNRSWAHLRKYFFKKKGRKHMAKRRKSKGRKSTRRRTTRRTHGRRHHSGGGGSGLAALKHDVPRMLVAGVYGKLEDMATKDANFALNKLPKPLAAVGYTGNVALALYAATFATKNKWVRLGASVIATIATYKLGKNGAMFTDATKVGDDDDYLGDDERLIEDNVMGALEAEGMERTVQPGLRYEDVVQDASTRV